MFASETAAPDTEAAPGDTQGGNDEGDGEEDSQDKDENAPGTIPGDDFDSGMNMPDEGDGEEDSQDKDENAPGTIPGDDFDSGMNMPDEGDGEEDGHSKPDTQFPASMVSGTLPVIYINTEDWVSIPDTKDEYISSKYWLDNMGLEGVESIGSEEEPLDLGIRRRGNSTWTMYDKKPYKIKLDKKASLLGMPENKHWALMAHADGSFACNYFHDALGFEASRILQFEWTPTEKPVEFVLNGEYMGVYYICETIRVDKNRLDIDEQKDLQDKIEKIENGGWLIELDNYGTELAVWEKNEDSSIVLFTPDTPEVLSDAQRTYILSCLNDMNRAIYSEDLYYNNLFDIVDKESLAKYYIIQELLFNWDGFCGSTYFYRKGGDDKKWYWGPVWDFGNAFTTTKTGDIDGWFFEKSQYRVRWIQQIVKHPQFINEVKKYWNEYGEQLIDGLCDALDNVADEIGGALDQDYVRWTGLKGGHVRLNDLIDAGEIVKGQLATRKKFLDENWPLNYEYSFATTDHKTWDKIYAYGWHETDDDSVSEFLGEWPGTMVDVDDQEQFRHVFNSDYTIPDAKIIFHTGEYDFEYEEQNSEFLFTYENGKTYSLSPKASINIEVNELQYELNDGTLNAFGDVWVYDIAGALVGKLSAGNSAQLPSGVYILKAQNHVTKAIVK